MPRLLLVRHGETVQNTQKRFQGHSSLPLSDRGKRQAVALAEWLRHEEIDVTYHSGLPRASETAAILRSALDLDWSEAAELRELNFGEWDGLTREEIRLRDPETLGHWELDPDRNPPPGGESLADLDLRVRAFLRRLTEARPGGTALVVSHGGPIRLIVCAALGLPRDWHWRFAVSPGSLSEVVVDPGGAVLTRLNVAPPTSGES